jgi:hypothetical protein
MDETFGYGYLEPSPDWGPASSRPKTDERFLELKRQALRGEVPIYHAYVPLGLCVPSDLDYRPDLTQGGLAELEATFNEAKQGRLQSLVVYPRGMFFVVASDYIPFFAALHGMPDYVPCWVLGEPDNPLVQQVGGPLREQDVHRILSPIL